MFCVDSVAKKSYFTEETNSHNDADHYNNFNEYFSNNLCHAFFVNFISDPEKHFLLEVGFNSRLLIYQLLRDRHLFFARNCPEEVVFKSLWQCLNSYDNSPERLRDVLFDLNVGTGKRKTVSFLDLYFSRTKDRRLVMRTSIVLVGRHENQRFQIVRVAQHTSIEGELIEVWFRGQEDEMAEIEVKRKIVSSIRKFVSLRLTVFSDVKRSADTLGLKVCWKVFSSVVAVDSLSLVLSKDHDHQYGKYDKCTHRLRN